MTERLTNDEVVDRALAALGGAGVKTAEVFLRDALSGSVDTKDGEIESVIQQRIDQNRGKVRVAADLSQKGIAEIDAQERMQSQLAEQALSDFEVELGIKSPDTTNVTASAKDLGPAATQTDTQKQTS